MTSYHAIITYSCPEQAAGSEFSVGAEQSRLIGKAEATGKSWNDKEAIELPGVINLLAGDSVITIKAAGTPQFAFLQLYRIELRPVRIEKEADTAE